MPARRCSRLRTMRSAISASTEPGLFGSRGGGRRRRRRCRDRRRLGRFVLLAVGNHVARATIRFRRPLLFEFFYELAQRRLLLSRRQLRLDRRFGLLERLLAACRDRLHLEDVVAERSLDRPCEHVLLGREDSRVERLLLLAFDDARQLAAGGLARRVDRHALGYAFKALARFDFVLGFLRLSFGLREDDQQVAFFGEREASRVFLVVLRDLRLRDFRLLFDDLLLDLLRKQVQLHAQQQVGHALPGRFQEFFEFRRLRELLTLDFFELLLDFRVGALHDQRFRFSDHALGGDAEPEHLLLQRFVPLRTLSLQRGFGRRRLPFS